MPQVRGDIIGIGVLLLCVPFQYFLVRGWGRSEIGRSYALKEFLNGLDEFRSNYLQWDSWQKWCISLILDEGFNQEPSYSSMYPFDPNDPEGESPAVEVIKYKQKEQHFAMSPEPRIYRSPEMKFSVGQVVKHKFYKYRGVVIGWDESPKGPSEMLIGHYAKDKKELLKMPNYSVLVDIRDRLNPQVAYVPQDNLVPIANTRVVHPLLDAHFEDFDGEKYIARPWLKVLYPKD